LRPTQLEALRQVRGIGERRLADLGPELIRLIVTHLQVTGHRPPQDP